MESQAEFYLNQLSIYLTGALFGLAAQGIVYHACQKPEAGSKSYIRTIKILFCISWTLYMMVTFMFFLNHPPLCVGSGYAVISLYGVCLTIADLILLLRADALLRINHPIFSKCVIYIGTSLRFIFSVIRIAFAEVTYNVPEQVCSLELFWTQYPVVVVDFSVDVYTTVVIGFAIAKQLRDQVLNATPNSRSVYVVVVESNILRTIIFSINVIIDLTLVGLLNLNLIPFVAYKLFYLVEDACTLLLISYDTALIRFLNKTRSSPSLL